MRACLGIWLLSLSLLTPPALAGDRIIARVGNEAVTQRELEAALAQSPDLSRSKILELLIERRLVLAWAASKNITAREDEVQQMEDSILQRNNLTPDQFEKALASRGEAIAFFRENLKEQITINKAIGTALGGKVQVSESELQELYLETYPRQTVFDVSHILWSLDPQASVEEEASIRLSAEEVLEKFLNGEAFGALAREYSQDGTTSGSGGRLGTFREGELLQELEALALTLEPGEAGGPVRTSAGYHILLLNARELSQPPPFTEVKGALERALFNQKEETLRTQWLKELKETTYIEVFADGG